MGMGDLKVAESRQSAELHQTILDACSAALSNEENQANCSGFVKDAASKLGIKVGTTGNGQANDIFDEIDSSPWIPLGTGHAAAVKAAYYALEGFFVIAAWRNDSGNGHVAVVTDLVGLQNRGAVSDRNVAASWGVLNNADLAQENGPIRESFGSGKREHVKYAAQFINKFK